MSQRYADIIIDISHEAIDKPFQYKIPEELEGKVDIGSLVKVPFGNGSQTRKGYIIEIHDEPRFDVNKTKSITDVDEKGIPIEGTLIRLADWIRRTYGSTMISALKTVMPVKLMVKKVKSKISPQEFILGTGIVDNLNASQQKLVDEFEQDLDLPEKKVYLLHGITGSGKTEVYIECAKKVISEGKQAIVLIPEISLSAQTLARFRQHFGDRVVSINSRQNQGERYRAIESIRNHDADVIIGPRSALFAPCDKLGLIIMDEEHDGSYKSEQTPMYHARDVLIERARLENIPAILGSATPSIESYTMATEGKFRLWELLERPDESELPSVSIVDMRAEMKAGNKTMISKALYEGIADRLEKKEQTILFLNRRGINSCMSCRDCGDAIMCPRCDVSLSLHNNGMLMCHYCGFTMPRPKVCPSCKSPFIAGFGIGTQKVEKQINELFPSAKILRLDKDSVSRRGAYENILNSFRNREADILIGTQMTVKGHDFPYVTLVGSILADLTLFDNDYRSSERTFQLITQASGRAGRGSLKGEAIIQTYKPENYAMLMAKDQDYKGFYDTEMSYRRLMGYPPCSNFLVILFQSADEEKACDAAKNMHKYLKSRITFDRKTIMLEPAEARIAKKNNIYRRIICVKGSELGKIYDIMKLVNEYGDTPENVAENSNKDVLVSVDLNPMSAY